MKWFPARKTGLIAGIVVAGFGLASVYISPLANYFTGYNLAGKPHTAMEELITGQDQGGRRVQGRAGSADARLRPTRQRRRSSPRSRNPLPIRRQPRRRRGDKLLALKEGNIQKTLLIFGIGFLIVVTILSQLMVAPPPGYSPPDAAAAASGMAAPAALVNIGPMEMLKTPLFYLLWIMFAFGAGVGLMIISMVTTIAKLGNIEAGFILVALLAVGNASGRILAGMLSDSIGRLWTMFIIFVFQAVLMMVLRTGLTDMTVFIIVSMLIGFNYGSCLSVFPSAVKDNFGLKNFGVNYGLVFTSWGVGGSVLPFIAGKFFETAKKATGTGSYDNAYLMAAAVAGSGGHPDLRHARDRETPQGRHRRVGGRSRCLKQTARNRANSDFSRPPGFFVSPRGRLKLAAASCEESSIFKRIRSVGLLPPAPLPLPQLLPETVDRPLRLLRRSVVADDDIRGGEFLVDRHLRGEPRHRPHPGDNRCAPSAGGSAPPAGDRRGGPDRPAVSGPPQGAAGCRTGRWHRAGPRGFRRSAFATPSKHRRMDEAVEQFQLLPVPEDDRAELPAVDRPIGVEDCPAEMVHDLPPDRTLRLLDGVGDLVEIDDEGAFIRQHPGDGRFTAGDTACQSDIQHCL